MSVRTIVTAGHPALREPAPELSASELAAPATQALIDDLIETMRAAGGAGLAATQIAEPVRVAVIEVNDNPRYPYKPRIPLTVIVNPVIEPLDDERFAINEGCLSVPGLRGEVNRHVTIKLRYLDRDGVPHKEIRRGLTAGTFQHELDHLDGILFLDRVRDPRTFMTWEESSVTTVTRSSRAHGARGAGRVVNEIWCELAWLGDEQPEPGVLLTRTAGASRRSPSVRHQARRAAPTGPDAAGSRERALPQLPAGSARPHRARRRRLVLELA